MAKNKTLGVAEQQFGWEQTRGVTKDMIRAGSKGKSRIKAGLRAAWLAKTTSMYGDDTTKTARALRLFGFDETAKWYDRFFAVETKKPQKMRRGRDGMPPSQRRTAVSDGKTLEVITSGFKQVSGELTVVNSRLTKLGGMIVGVGAAVSSVHQDVKDIKSLIMPKKILARGATYTDEWGRENTKASGHIQPAHYNPLAPAGSQFVESKLTTPKGWGKGFKVHGAPTSKPIEKGYLQSAIKQASMQTAILVLKMEKRDKEREDEDKKRQEEMDQFKFKDEEEYIRNPVDELKKHMDERLDGIEGKLTDIGSKKKGGLFDLISGMFGGLMPLIKILLYGGVAALGLFIGEKVGKWLNDTFDLSRRINDAIESALGFFGFGNKAEREKAEQDALKSINLKSAEINKKLEGTGYKRTEMTVSKDGLRHSGGGFVDAQGNKVLAKDLPNEIKEKLGMPVPQPRTRSTGMRNVRRRSRTSGQTSWVDSVSTPPTGELRLANETYEERLASLGDAIASGESGGDYNIYNKGTIGKNKGKIGHENLSEMTIAEYLRRGSLDKNDPQKMFAVGKYQIIPDTMREAIKKLGLDPNTTYLTPETQEMLFRDYLIEGKPAVKKWLMGKSDDKNAAMLALAKEWASVGVPEDIRRKDGVLIRAGESYYSGVGGNKAHTSTEDIMTSITPASSSSGKSLDSGNRELQAANSPTGGGLTVVKGPTIHNQTNNTTAKRPAIKADVVTRDEALVRSANRDSRHPVYG